MKEKIKQYQGYFIITILYMICIFFIPMMGSSVGVKFLIPTTAAGWVIWIVSKLAVILINMLIFDQFIRQGKINVKDNPNFLKAQAIFNKLDTPEEEYLPTPREYFGKMYRSKGIKLFLSSLLSLVAFSNAILSFNWITMLTYLFTIIVGIIFGWINMLEVENYWTDTYFKLALKIEKEKISEEIIDGNNN